jgi:general secretion pathway protein G
MLSASIQSISRKPVVLVFTVSALAVVLAMLPGCGGEGKDSSLPKKISSTRSQIKLIGASIDNYKLDVGTYPSSIKALLENVDQAAHWNGPYLPSYPKDPWGNDYQYVVPGKHNPMDFDLYSFGPDGREGGEGADADITNWE